ADLDRAVRGPLPPGADLPAAAPAPGARRARQGGGLPQPRPDRPDARADPDAAAEGPGARPVARPHRVEHHRADDGPAAEVPPREPGDRGPDRGAVAAAALPAGGGPAAADDRPAADADGLRQLVPGGPPQRPRPEGGRGGHAAGGVFRAAGDEGG